MASQSDKSVDVIATPQASATTADASKADNNEKFSFSMSLLDLYYSNLNKIFRKFKMKQSLDASDIGTLDDPTLEEARVSSISPEFEKKWNEEKVKYSDPKKRSLFRVLIKTIGIWDFFVVLFLNAVVVGLSFSIPQLTSAISNHQSGIDPLPTPVYNFLIALMFICPYLGALCSSRFNMKLNFVLSKIGAALISKLYNKVLTVRPSSKHSTGMLTTLYTTDVTNVKLFPTLIMTLIFAPAQAAIALGLIYYQVGIAMFVGLACSIAIFPLSSVAIYYMNQAIKSRREYQVERVKLTTDVINGIKISKYYSWEGAFQDAISKFRETEIHWNKRVMFSFSISSLFADGIPHVQPILVFYTYIKLGNTLTFTKAFVTIMLFNILKGPIAALSAMISNYFTSLNSTTKLLEFLNSDDLIEYVATGSAIDDGKTAIKVEDVSMGWVTPEEANEEAEKLKKEEAELSKTSVKEDKKYEAVASADLVEVEEVNRHVNTLVDVSFSVQKGELLVITGQVGSGKTSILKGLLNGLNLFKGKISLDGSVAYHAQQPWILNATVRENILFGREEDKDLFEKCLDLSCLKADLASFTNGLDTEIGDKGATLSGGQKARISFARALYRNTDIVILDDPLSAVDSAVGRKMFSDGIVNHLCGRGKTVLLVTHQVHLLVDCKNILVIDEGKIIARGSYHDVENHLVEPQEEEIDPTPAATSNTSVAVEAVITTKERRPSIQKQASVKITPKKDDKKDVKKLVKDEEKFEGMIPLSVYKFYLVHGAPTAFFCSLIMIIGFMTAQILANFWLAYWGEREAEYLVKTGDTLSPKKSLYYLQVYATILMVGVLMNYLKVLLGIVHTANVTRSLHSDLLSAVLNAPSYWFDITPMGRIITRFTNDLELLGFVHYLAWYAFISFCGVIASVITICITTRGVALVLLVPLCIGYYFLYVNFSSVTVDLTRIESLNQSPININFMQTINGMDSIKTYKESARFFSKISKATDSVAVAFLTKAQTFQWLSIRLDSFGAVLSFSITLLTALTLKRQFIPPAQLALAMVFIIQLPQQLTLLIGTLTYLGNMMSSVQRIKGYIDDVPNESEYLSNIPHINRSERVTQTKSDVATGTEMVKIKSVVKPPPEWPSEGVIKSEELQLGYYGGPDILKGVNFLSRPKEKIGVIGRTGSGKSTLVTALFHIELVRGGKVFIDGIDISTVDIHHLRSKLCIIPQDPVMFVGNVRYNLDPFNVYKDEEIWDVLTKTRMKHDVEHLPHKLLEPVAEGGSNFSIGQRQLICFARALLKKPKILILDEATASVDNETDAHVQHMIRDLFKDCTVMTIAHRLNTIIDSDRIMVLGQGKVVEFDSPKVLLENPESHFAKMWNDFKKEHEAH